MNGKRPDGASPWPSIPPALARIVSRLPQWPPSAALAFGLNLALGRAVARDALEALQGRRIAVQVTDAGLHLKLDYSARGFSPSFDSAAADVTIRAASFDLLELVRRQVDADSLFFNRRLVMEGDTELGLLVKNTLESVDFDALFETLPLPGRVRDVLSARYRRSA